MEQVDILYSVSLKIKINGELAGSQKTLSKTILSLCSLYSCGKFDSKNWTSSGRSEHENGDILLILAKDYHHYLVPIKN